MPVVDPTLRACRLLPTLTAYVTLMVTKAPVKLGASVGAAVGASVGFAVGDDVGFDVGREHSHAVVTPPLVAPQSVGDEFEKYLCKRGGE